MKKRIAALASVPVLVLGGAAVAGAQTGGDDSSDTGIEPAPVEAPAPDHVGRKGPRFGGPEAMAEALGMDPSELRDAVRGGQTIAEIAEAQGVDIDAVIADLVAQAEARVAELDNPQVSERFDPERLTERLTALVNGEIPPRAPGRQGPGHRGEGPKGPRFGGPEAMAEALGMDPSELRDAVRGGQTIAEIAEAQGVDIDAVIADLVAQAEARVAELDNPQVSERFDPERLTERLTALVNGEIPPRAPGHRGPGPQPGGADGTQADGASLSA